MKKIVVDAGHGGSDPGTIGNGIVEKDINLKISKYLNDRFKSLGLESALTRDSDITLDPNVRPKKAQSFFGTGEDIIIVSNHVNSGGGDGAEVIYSLRNNDTLSKMIASEFEKAGQNFRKYYQRRLPSNPSKDYYYLLRNTPNNETIIVEYGFVDSTGDDVDLLKNNWQDLAEAVVKAVSEYAGVKYSLPLTEKTYTVKSGDSLWSIAKKYNLTVDKLKELNGLTTNLLRVGQILKVADDTEISIDDDTYTVKSGDTLYSIAQKNNTTVDDLKTLNGLDNNNLSINQVLKLPKDNKNEYVVKKGDTLYSIAKLYGVSIDDLISENNLTNSNLQVGQVLLIPREYQIYTVVSGDTLYSIAKKMETTVSNIIELNNLNSSVLSIGQKLLIP